MCCVELAFLVVGIITLYNGHFRVNEDLDIYGRRAKLIGYLFLSAMPINLVLGLLIGLLSVLIGLPEGIIVLIAIIVEIVVLVALTVAILVAVFTAREHETADDVEAKMDEQFIPTTPAGWQNQANPKQNKPGGNWRDGR